MLDNLKTKTTNKQSQLLSGRESASNAGAL